MLIQILCVLEFKQFLKFRFKTVQAKTMTGSALNPPISTGACLEWILGLNGLKGRVNESAVVSYLLKKKQNLLSDGVV